MAYFSNVNAQRDGIFAKTSAGTKASNKRGLFRRFLAALMESRQRQADHEIARYMRGRGGKLTDDVEREIERHILPRASTRF